MWCAAKGQERLYFLFLNIMNIVITKNLHYRTRRRVNNILLKTSAVNMISYWFNSKTSQQSLSWPVASLARNFLWGESVLFSLRLISVYFPPTFKCQPRFNQWIRSPTLLMDPISPSELFVYFCIRLILKWDITSINSSSLGSYVLPEHKYVTV